MGGRREGRGLGAALSREWRWAASSPSSLFFPARIDASHSSQSVDAASIEPLAFGQAPIAPVQNVSSSPSPFTATTRPFDPPSYPIAFNSTSAPASPAFAPFSTVVRSDSSFSFGFEREQQTREDNSFYAVSESNGNGAENGGGWSGCSTTVDERSKVRSLLPFSTRRSSPSPPSLSPTFPPTPSRPPLLPPLPSPPSSPPSPPPPSLHPPPTTAPTLPPPPPPPAALPSRLLPPHTTKLTAVEEGGTGTGSTARSCRRSMGS